MKPREISGEQVALAQLHLAAFAKAFLRPDSADRWMTLARHQNPAKWRKLDAWDLWDEGKRAVNAQFQEIDVAVASLAYETLLAPWHVGDAVVIALGHAPPEVCTVPLQDLAVLRWPVEGVVSVQAGRCALVTNHDGDVLLCTCRGVGAPASPGKSGHAL